MRTSRDNKGVRDRINVKSETERDTGVLIYMIGALGPNQYIELTILEAALTWLQSNGNGCGAYWKLYNRYRVG
jgi:hypothetical protein